MNEETVAAEHGPNTPGVLGYVVAVFISILVFSVSMAAAYTGDEYFGPDTPLEFVLWTIIAFGYVALLAVPMAVFVVPTVHMLCSQVPRQWVHVVVTATTSSLLGLAVMVVLALIIGGAFSADVRDYAEVGVLVGLIGVASAMGRTLVVPLVWRRRRKQSPTTLGAAGPV